MIIQTRQFLKLVALMYSVLVVSSSAAYAAVIDTNAVMATATATVFSPRLCQSESTDADGKKKGSEGEGEEEEEPDCD